MLNSAVESQTGKFERGSLRVGRQIADYLLEKLAAEAANGRFGEVEGLAGFDDLEGAVLETFGIELRVLPVFVGED